MTKNHNKKSSAQLTRAQVRQMLREHDLATREVKRYIATDSRTLSAAGVVVPITGNIVQGDNISNRTGYMINITDIKLWVQASMNTAASNDRYRYILFFDRLNLGTAPAVTDVLDSASVISEYNYFAKTTNRFKVLVDNTIAMSINGSNRGVNRKHSFKFKNPIPVHLLGTTNNYGMNSLFILVIDDLGANNSTNAVEWSVGYFDS